MNVDYKGTISYQGDDKSCNRQSLNEMFRVKFNMYIENGTVIKNYVLLPLSTENIRHSAQIYTRPDFINDIVWVRTMNIDHIIIDNTVTYDEVNIKDAIKIRSNVMTI